MRRMIVAGVLAALVGTAPAAAQGVTVSCPDLETMRSPTKGAPARLVVKNERTSDVNLKVVRHNGSEVSIGSVKGGSSREVTTRLRYLFAIYEGGQCLMGVRMANPVVNVIVK